MNGSLSQFKAAQRRKADRKDKSNSKFGVRHSSYSKSEVRPVYNFPELSEDELQAVKDNIKANFKREREKSFIIVLLISIVAAVFIYFLIAY